MSGVTYLFVHGAFSGSWCWREVGREMAARDLAWETVDLPSAALGANPHTYLIDDARAVASMANELGPVILVGHSYGGSVISEAASLVEDLRGLIYVAAIVPEVNESTTDASRLSDERTLLDQAIVVTGEMLSLNPGLAVEALAQDCLEGQQRFIVEHLSTQTLASFRSPRENADTDAWRRYILCEFDQAVSPSAQVLFGQRCDEIIALAAGHSPFFSMPHTLTDAIVA